jgi:LysR family transcriptional regulator of gallate degradation
MLLAPLLKKLRAVQAVAETGHTVGAAACLHLSQSAVVRAVQDVEAAIALPLFERSARGMQATALGRRLSERIGRALQLLAQANGQPLPEPRGWHASRVAASASHRHLQAFLALAATSHMKAAAESLGISLPAMHQTLNQLEHLAGHPLYQRWHSGVRLTEAGETAERFFKLALAELAQADEEISIQQGELRAHIVIGTLPFSTGLFLPQALEEVLSLHPGVQVTVIDGTYESLLHKLRSAEIDLLVGALRQQPPFDDVVQEELFADPLCVVARQGHPLQRRSPRRLRELTTAQWIMPMPGTPAQAAFDEAFELQGLRPPAATLRVNSPVLIQSLLMATDRLALMSRRQAHKEVLAGRLCILPVDIAHAPRRIGITTRLNFLPAPASQSLLAQFRAATQDMLAETAEAKN